MLNRSLQPIIQAPQLQGVVKPETIAFANGTTLHVLRGGSDDVVRIDILFKGGRWHQSQSLQALFTNRMLREGTRRFTTTQIAEKLDFYGALLELSTSTEHSFITLYSLCRYLPETLEVLESMVKEPLFPANELEVVATINLQQFKVNTSKVDFLAHRAMMNSLYGDEHPTGRLVQEADYGLLTSEVLRAFYEAHYNSKGCSIYVAGGVTDDSIKRLEKLFGSESFGSVSSSLETPQFAICNKAPKRTFSERGDALQSAVRMGLATIPVTHDDFPSIRVVNTLLGGYFGSRLMSSIREEKGYTYGISSMLIPYPDSNLWVIHTETANEYVEPLIAEVYKEIHRLQTEPVSREELAVVQNYMLGEMCRMYDSYFSLSDAWIYAETSHLNDMCFERQAQAIQQITPDKIQSLAQKYLSDEHIHEFVVGAII